MPADLIAMVGAELDVLESVERKVHREIATFLPPPGVFLIIRSLDDRPLRLSEACIEHLVAWLRRGRPQDQRTIGEILQMALAHQRGGITRGAQSIHEGIAVESERCAVAAHAMQGWHPPGHQR